MAIYVSQRWDGNICQSEMGWQYMSVRDGMAIYPYHSFPSIPFPREKERLRRKFLKNNLKRASYFSIF